MKLRKKAFTLTELLVIVIVLGVLAAVAVPKFSRVLETRKTTEAEDLLSAVRTEQEHRCLSGKSYTATRSLLPMTDKTQSKFYALGLKAKGAVAARGDAKDYELRILYNSGEMCCSGAGCDALNKSYARCGPDWGGGSDECAPNGPEEPVVPPQTDPCETNPNSCACPAYAAAHACECRGECTPCEEDPVSCACNPQQEKCCSEKEMWNNVTKKCETKDDCKAGTQYIGTTNKYSLDTCDGDISAKYTCTGSYRGTCIDVYSGLPQAKALTSYARDPFAGFGGLELAQSVPSRIPPGQTTPMDPDLKIDDPMGVLCPDGRLAHSLAECSASGGGVVVDKGDGSVEAVIYYSKRKVICCGSGETDDKLCDENAQTCLAQGKIFKQGGMFKDGCGCLVCPENQITQDGLTCQSRTPCGDTCPAGYIRSPDVQYQEQGSCCVKDTCTSKPWWGCGGLTPGKCAAGGWDGGTEWFGEAPDYISTYKCLDKDNQPCQSPNCKLPSCADNAFFRRYMGLCCKSALGNRPECCGCAEMMPHDWCGTPPPGQVCEMKCKKCKNALGNACSGCGAMSALPGFDTPPDGYIPTPGEGGLLDYHQGHISTETQVESQTPDISLKGSGSRNQGRLATP